MAIATAYFKHKLDDTGNIVAGYFNYARQKPINQVIDQVKAKLAMITNSTGETALDHAYWVTSECKDVFPPGEPFVAMRY